MPPKLSDTNTRINMLLPDDLARRFEAWRRTQSDFPNASEAVRRLVELGLEAAAAKAKKAGKGR